MDQSLLKNSLYTTNNNIVQPASKQAGMVGSPSGVPVTKDANGGVEFTSNNTVLFNTDFGQASTETFGNGSFVVGGRGDNLNLGVGVNSNFMEFASMAKFGSAGGGDLGKVSEIFGIADGFGGERQGMKRKFEGIDTTFAEFPEYRNIEDVDFINSVLKNANEPTQKNHSEPFDSLFKDQQNCDLLDYKTLQSQQNFYNAGEKSIAPNFQQQQQNLSCNQNLILDPNHHNLQFAFNNQIGNPHELMLLNEYKIGNRRHSVDFPFEKSFCPNNTITQIPIIPGVTVSPKEKPRRMSVPDTATFATNDDMKLKGGVSMRPRCQKLRFSDDLYTPLWVRNTGQAKEGFCDTCSPGKWLQLKNSAYWYHKQFYHGISSVSGRPFIKPIQIYQVDNDTVEGLCHQCLKWVVIATSKRQNSVLWYRHAHKCHVYHKPKSEKSLGMYDQEKMGGLIDFGNNKNFVYNGVNGMVSSVDIGLGNENRNKRFALQQHQQNLQMFGNPADNAMVRTESVHVPQQQAFDYKLYNQNVHDIKIGAEQSDRKYSLPMAQCKSATTLQAHERSNSMSVGLEQSNFDMQGFLNTAQQTKSSGDEMLDALLYKNEPEFF
ncbi:hypothetical protein BB559_002542 [Furculomyces boomerangus]|uniref:Transcription regulator Rua1 C-terminal domain-containing protein n=1 Tax=Furculomyces boomerangus TaxID=61424 RepID=A0A2T9YUD8_9FUNG|nr:hypothetical protein BB559_002542 [Furculomyces boomerangus]